MNSAASGNGSAGIDADRWVVGVGIGDVFAAGGAFTASFEQEFARLARRVAPRDMPAGHPSFLWSPHG